MLERRYKLDKNKTINLSAAEYAALIGARRHTVWAWFKGINHIPERAFNRLLTTSGLQPADLLDQASLEFYANNR